MPSENDRSVGLGRGRIALFYHRPIDDPYHGGSRHCKSFVDGLESSLSVIKVCPRWTVSAQAPSPDQGKVRLAGAKYLLQAFLAGARFVAQDRLESDPTMRVRGAIAFDVYLAGLAAVWSRIRGVQFIYYPQDSGESVASGWSRSGVRGALLFRAFRALPERLAVSVASIIIVPSVSVEKDYVRTGVEPRRIRRCTLKREMPRYSPENVQGWQTRFKLDTRVGVVFVGSFQYPPNVRAFEYICSKLAPRLSQSEATAQILVAGLGSEPFAKNLPDNVQVLGTVDDLDGLLYASAVGIAPMDVAGGTSGKVVDFMLHGLTTVATPEAVQGVENSELLHVVPLDHFADMVIRLAKAWKADPHRAGPPEADSRYREIYTGSEDLDRIAREIRAQAFASRAGTEPTA